MEIDKDQQINLVYYRLKRLFCIFVIVGMFIDLEYIFLVKIQLFVILKSDHDPDSDPHGSALVWLRIRIEIKSLIRIHIEASGDPQPMLRICITLMPIRIRIRILSLLYCGSESGS